MNDQSREPEETTRGSLVRRLRATREEDQSVVMMDALRERIAARLGRKPADVLPREQFMAMGVTSLEALELRRRLEEDLDLRLRSSLVFDYPNLEALVRFLIGRLGLAPAKSNLPIASAPMGRRAPDATNAPNDDCECAGTASVDSPSAQLEAELRDLDRDR